MKLSRERIVIGAVLGLGLAALIVDQALFKSGTGPAEATASVPKVEVDSSSAAKSPRLTGPVVGPQADHPLSLADRFVQIADARGLDDRITRNAFMPARVGFDSGPIEAGKSSIVQVQSENDQFCKKYELMAVMMNRKNAYAIVNGKPIKVGQAISSGFKLIAVNERSAIFESGNGKVTLELQKPEL